MQIVVCGSRNIVAHIVHCLTAWPHPNDAREEIRRKPTTLYRTHCIVHDEVVFVNLTKGRKAA